MPTERWKKSRTTVYNVSYHIIWCVKYRRKILTDNIDKRLKELIIEKSKDIDIQIEKMETDKDHIHLFIKASPTKAIHWIVQQLKGYTSRILRQEISEVRTRLPSLWTRSYYVETIGHISEQTIKKYIQEQRNK
jgi:putative transposase